MDDGDPFGRGEAFGERPAGRIAADGRHERLPPGCATRGIGPVTLTPSTDAPHIEGSSSTHASDLMARRDSRGGHDLGVTASPQDRAVSWRLPPAVRPTAGRA